MRGHHTTLQEHQSLKGQCKNFDKSQMSESFDVPAVVHTREGYFISTVKLVKHYTDLAKCHGVLNWKQNSY